MKRDENVVNYYTDGLKIRTCNALVKNYKERFSKSIIFFLTRSKNVCNKFHKSPYENVFIQSRLDSESLSSFNTDCLVCNKYYIIYMYVEKSGTSARELLILFPWKSIPKSGKRDAHYSEKSTGTF